MKKELRFQNSTDENLSMRAVQNEDGSRYLEGYAIVFDQRSKLIFEDGELFTEVIKRGALDELFKRKESLDILYTFQHNMNEPMSRYNPQKGSDTLELEVDDIGLKFRAKIPNTSLGNDTYELVRSGVLYETSFIFTVDERGQYWVEDKTGDEPALTRYITSLTGLYDVSTVVRAAYDGTTTKVSRADFEGLLPKDDTQDKEDEERAAEAEKEAQRKRFSNKVKVRLHQLKK